MFISQTKIHFPFPLLLSWPCPARSQKGVSSKSTLFSHFICAKSHYRASIILVQRGAPDDSGSKFEFINVSILTTQFIVSPCYFSNFKWCNLPKFVPLCPVQWTNPTFHDSTAHMTRTRTRFGAMFSAIPGTHPGNGRVTTPRGVQKERVCASHYPAWIIQRDFGEG